MTYQKETPEFLPNNKQVVPFHFLFLFYYNQVNGCTETLLRIRMSSPSLLFTCLISQDNNPTSHTTILVVGVNFIHELKGICS